jgi:hypothetical protein
MLWFIFTETWVAAGNNSTMPIYLKACRMLSGRLSHLLQIQIRDKIHRCTGAQRFVVRP